MTNQWSDAPGNLHATTIEEVIHSLDRIVDWSKTQNQRTGYFAALYRKVTVRIKQGIESGEFDDGERMERLDVIFANRYLDAFEAYANNQQVSEVWKLAFDLSDNWFPLVIVHLLIGMNAHINFDLGIAAAQTVDVESLPDLKPDFEKINKVLGDMVDEVQTELAQIWPLFKTLDHLAGSLDERLAKCGMNFSRDMAWAFAEKLGTKSEGRDDIMKEKDDDMTAIGRLFLSPGIIKNTALLIIRVGERGNIARKITILE